MLPPTVLIKIHVPAEAAIIIEHKKRAYLKFLQYVPESLRLEGKLLLILKSLNHSRVQDIRSIV